MHRNGSSIGHDVAKPTHPPSSAGTLPASAGGAPRQGSYDGVLLRRRNSLAQAVQDAAGCFRRGFSNLPRWGAGRGADHAIGARQQRRVTRTASGGPPSRSPGGRRPASRPVAADVAALIIRSRRGDRGGQGAWHRSVAWACAACHGAPLTGPRTGLRHCRRQHRPRGLDAGGAPPATRRLRRSEVADTRRG